MALVVALPPGPKEVETWIFDLDNTLYPAASNLFVQVSSRMTQYIAALFDITPDEARALQRQYFFEHGTTLRGLMTVHNVDPHAFMDFVHDIDLTVLEPAAALEAALAALPGRKLVYTNGSRRHAERVLARLGLSGRFDGIFDIAAGDWQPKPAPSGYGLLVDRFAIQPSRAAMVEDIARNLKPAADLGMLTVWVDTSSEWAMDGAQEDWVHHRTGDLAAWLAGCRFP